MKEWTEEILKSKTDKICDYWETSRVGTGLWVPCLEAWVDKDTHDKEISWGEWAGWGMKQ